MIDLARPDFISCGYWVDDNHWIPIETASGPHWPFNRQAVDFPFDHYGLVQWHRHTGRHTVRYDIEHVRDRAIEETLRGLATLPPAIPCTIEHKLHGAWASVSVPAQHAEATILRSLAWRGVDWFGPTIRTREQSVASLDQAGTRDAFRRWRDDRRGAGLRAASPISVVFGHLGGSDFSLDHIGDRSATARFFGRDWAHGAVGGASTPDVEIDRTTCLDYAEIVGGAEVRVDEVIAHLDSPVLHGKQWRRYRRLLLPIQRPGLPDAVQCVIDVTGTSPHTAPA